jgi:hypothetical protein
MVFDIILSFVWFQIVSLQYEVIRDGVGVRLAHGMPKPS